MNGTRAFSTKFGKPGQPLSIGRVQTPVLALLYDRQTAIENFKPQKFYEVEATFAQGPTTYKGIWVAPERVFELGITNKIADKVKGKQGTIVSFDTVDSNEHPPPLYDLGELQRDANAKLGFTTDHTLKVAQRLYEEHAAISYPRTNSNYVADDNIPVMHQVLELFKTGPYASIAQRATKSIVSVTNKNVCRPEEIDDHHAIFPTENIPQLFDLTKDEKNLYDLIVRRFMSHFYPDAAYKKHAILTEVQNEKFRTSIKELMNKGWKVVYETVSEGDSEEELGSSDTLVEELKENFELYQDRPVRCINAEPKERTTTAPKWFTEGLLIKAMKTAGKEITDEKLKSEMKGLELGTPATRSNIIETLKKRDYIVLNKRKLVVTSKGKSLIQTIRSTDLTVLTSPEMTAVWEKYLRSISTGQASENQFMSSVRQFTEKIVTKVKDHQGVPKDSFVNTFGVCPSCGEGKIVETKKAYSCSNQREGCPFTIWKVQFNKAISVKNLQDLLIKGKTAEMKFKGKTEYLAKLVLDDKKTGKVTLEFSNKKKSVK